MTANLRDFTAASTTRIRWREDVSLGTIFAGDGLEQTLNQFAMYDVGRVQIALTALNHRFTAAFEATGRFIVTASDGETVEFLLANADLTETYDWTPDNSAEITAFVAHVRNLTDFDATLTLTDEAVSTVAPVFADDTGDAQAWMQNTAITPITVPEATGTPTPTYAAVDLPNGVAFDPATRVISGTPDTAGSGTVTITATNSAGSATWTVAYTIAAAIPALFFATIDVTTRAQSGGVSFYTVAGRGDSTGSVSAGSLDYATGMDVDRIMKLASPRMRFNDFSAGNTFQAVFRQAVTDGLALHLQVETDAPVQSLMVEISSGTGGWVNFTVDSDFFDTVVDLIVTGHSVKVAVALPAYVFP